MTQVNIKITFLQTAQMRIYILYKGSRSSETQMNNKGVHVSMGLCIQTGGKLWPEVVSGQRLDKVKAARLETTAESRLRQAERQHKGQKTISAVECAYMLCRAMVWSSNQAVHDEESVMSQMTCRLSRISDRHMSTQSQP